MSIPTPGETYAKLIEHLRLAQEDCAMMAHLVRDDDHLRAQGFLAIAELLKRANAQITKLATRRMQ